MQPISEMLKLNSFIQTKTFFACLSRKAVKSTDKEVWLEDSLEIRKEQEFVVGIFLSRFHTVEAACITF